MKYTDLRSLFWPILFITIIVTACSTPMKVNSDFDKSIDFSKYKTYAFYQLTDTSRAISELNRKRILEAIKSEMNKKGFTESSNPDLMVNALAILKDMKSVTANTNYMGYGGYYRPYGGGMGMSTTTYDVNNYKDGSLIIDIVDIQKKQLIWQGVGNKEIDGPIQDPDKTIPEAISKIMASFPPGMATKK
ncbi:DUF4136 domain-containing protein [Solitalea koreensis]|uniref:DUF4136 domain-containing protein n=1 Tax=Solitalea koreensis TaxID=543615 RepID=A0A521C4X6_9SPHI|nr:DUF4136 domain-containing protein [Solitalea koreensis]SMO54459.1 protein of unknown function [Solitalea koreensis]